MTFAKIVRRFWCRSEGTVPVVAALVIPALLGIVGLVGEYGYGLVVKAQAQRASDLAAFAGALGYSAKGTTAAMQSASAYVAALNGVSSTNVTTNLVTSPRTAGSNAVAVNIGKTKELTLAPLVGGPQALTVRSGAYAQLTASNSACIIALNGSGTGVTLSGGTAVTAQNCAVASNVSVSVPCGTRITTKSLSYNTTAPSQPCNGIQAPAGGTLSIVKKLTVDPLSAEPAVTAATGRIATAAGLTAPSGPSVSSSGADLTFPWWGTSFTQGGCTATFDSGTSTWTFTCPAGGTYSFNNITINATVRFNLSNAATYNIGSVTVTGGSTASFGPGTYNVVRTITNSGTSMTFGAGTFNLGQGIANSAPASFGAGTFNVGKSTAACNSSAGYSICNSSTLTFGGPSSFVLAGGVFNSGGATLTLGSGTTNSFRIGAANDGNAVAVGGGSKTTFADATGAFSQFQFAGNINATAGGGSCMVLGAAAQHDVKGYFSTAGGNILGAGVYTVNGYIAFGANGGGNSTCNGSSVGVSATGVTLVTAAATTPSSGSCAGKAFCIGAGYSNVAITAPTTGSTAKLVVVGPTSTANTAGAAFNEGASGNSLSGAFYFPNGVISLTGGASIGDGAGQCLQLIGSSVSLAGGTATASSCFSSSAASRVVLVQ